MRRKNPPHPKSTQDPEARMKRTLLCLRLRFDFGSGVCSVASVKFMRSTLVGMLHARSRFGSGWPSPTTWHQVFWRLSPQLDTSPGTPPSVAVVHLAKAGL